MAQQKRTAYGSDLLEAVFRSQRKPIYESKRRPEL
jgi:hypothetical protein